MNQMRVRFLASRVTVESRCQGLRRIQWKSPDGERSLSRYRRGLKFSPPLLGYGKPMSLRRKLHRWEGKRRDKSEEESPKEESVSQFRKKRRDETEEEKVVSQLQAAIVDMLALAKQLKKLEEATPNTKVEIKTKIAEVMRCAAGMEKKSRRWQSALVRKMLSSKQRVAKEIIRPKGVDCGTQTDASPEVSGERAAARAGDVSGAVRYGEIKAALQMGGNFIDFQRISDLRWPKKLFSQTAEEQTDLLAKGWDWDIVLPVAGDFCMEGRDASYIIRTCRISQNCIHQV